MKVVLFLQDAMIGDIIESELSSDTLKAAYWTELSFFATENNKL